MKLYPDVADRRIRTILSDVAVVGLLVAFAWVGDTVHDAVNELTVLGSSLVAVGDNIQGGFQSVAGAVGGLPLIGDQLARALAGAGSGSGGEIAALGQQGIDTVNNLALVLGLVVFALPAVILLAFTLPRRIRQIRELTAAVQVLDEPDDPQRRQLLAMRAAFGLPYTTLVKYTKDPMGDLTSGNYDPLVAAALDEAGVDPAKALGSTSVTRRS